MKRIGKTDQGGILLEMTATDVQRLQQACEALGQLFDEVDGPAVVVADEAHRTFEATGTRLPDGSLKAKTIKPVATKARKSDEGKKACSVCGKMFVPPRSDSTCCSASCRGKAYRAAKVGGVKPVSVAKCLSCGRAFEPKRKDQTCCSKACRKAMPRKGAPDQAPGMTTIKVTRNGRPATKPEIEAAVAGKPLPIDPAKTKADRLALLKRLANKGVSAPAFAERSGQGPNLDDVPEFQRARSMAGEEG